MDALRVSLVIVGILLIAGIYLYSKRDVSASDKRFKIKSPHSFLKLIAKLKSRQIKTVPDEDYSAAPATTSLEPHISNVELNELESIVPMRSPQMSDIAEDVSLIVELTSDQIAPEGEQLFIPLTLIGKRGKRFTGEAIRVACDEGEFVLKDTGIYYYEVEDAQGFKQNLLGLANILEPGTFDLEKMRTFDTPGLVLFLHLPAPLEAREAFDVLLKKGRRLAEVLEGDLCDDARNVLTNQTVGHLKEKVEAYRFKQKMTQIKHRR